MADDDLLQRLRRFETRFFPRYRAGYRDLVVNGQRPRTLFIGCSDSRIVPYVLTGSGPGELFMVRNVGNLLPPWDASHGFHGTVAAVEFAVLKLEVRDVIVCGHSDCGAIRALYQDPVADAPHMNRWLDLARDAMLPDAASPETLRATEQRSIVLQLERLASYPMVASRMAEGRLFLHGWHYVIEAGRVLVLDVATGTFVPAEVALADQRPAPEPAPFQLQ